MALGEEEKQSLSKEALLLIIKYSSVGNLTLFLHSVFLTPSIAL